MEEGDFSLSDEEFQKKYASVLYKTNYSAIGQSSLNSSGLLTSQRAIPLRDKRQIHQPAERVGHVPQLQPEHGRGQGAGQRLQGLDGAPQLLNHYMKSCLAP
jgi:hypothetical protein